MTKGNRKKYWKRRVRRREKNSDVKHDAMMGNVVRRSYGACVVK
jgi:hypothetical protein